MRSQPARHIRTGAIILSGLALAAAPCRAQTETQSQAVSLRSADLARPEGRSRAQARIEEAAYSVCGAPWGSSREVRQEVRRSRCWRDAVASATAQLARAAAPQPGATRP